MHTHLLIIAALNIAIFNDVNAADCLSSQDVALLQTQQSDYFKVKFTPSFKHALEDGLITLRYETKPLDNAKENAKQCEAFLNVTIPPADLDTARRVLDETPAKKIMLTAQGYALPDSNTLQASFRVNTPYNGIPSSAYIQTTALGNLTSTLELIYAFVTQDQVNAIQLGASVKPWTDAQAASAIKQCQASPEALQNIDCTCKVGRLSQQLNYRDFENFDSVVNNPYAFATGSGKTLLSMLAAKKQACKPAK